MPFAVERVDAAGGVADDEVGRSGLRPDAAAHRDPAARRTALRVVRVDLPALGDLAGVGVEQVGGVDALEVAERRQQADADVDGAVADREDPAVAGHRVAVAVLDVERRLDPRVGVARRRPVGADRRPVRPLPGARRAERPAEAAVGAVGDDRELGADVDARAVLAGDGRAADEARGRRSGASPRGLRAAWRRRRRRCRRPSRRGRGGARRSRSSGTPDGSATPARARDPSPWPADP